MSKIRVIIKRPDEKYGHVTNISNTLENIQRTVEGYFQTIPLTMNSVIVCNEDGKIMGLEPNFKFGDIDIIVGTVFVCGVDGDEFTDIPFGLPEWKKYLEAWGN